MSALIGPLPGAPNNIHSECSSSKIKSFEAFSLESFTNSVLSTSAPLPFCKDGIYNHHQNGGSDDNKLSGDYGSKHCPAAPALPNVAIHTQSSSKFLADKDIRLGGMCREQLYHMYFVAFLLHLLTLTLLILETRVLVP